jgi:hypothetical protein
MAHASFEIAVPAKWFSLHYWQVSKPYTKLQVAGSKQKSS